MLGKQKLLQNSLFTYVIIITIIIQIVVIWILFNYVHQIKLNTYQKNLTTASDDLAEEIQQRLEFIGTQINYIAENIEDYPLKDTINISKIFNKIYFAANDKGNNIEKKNSRSNIFKNPRNNNQIPILKINKDFTAMVMANSNAGPVIAELKAKYLWQIDDSLIKDPANICILNNQQDILCSNGDNKLPILNDEYLSTTVNALPNTTIDIPPFTIISFINKQDIFYQAIQTIATGIIAIILFFIILLIVTKIFLSYMMSPLNKLRKQLLKYNDHVNNQQEQHELDTLLHSLNTLEHNILEQQKTNSTLAKIDKLILSSIDVKTIMSTIAIRMKKLLCAQEVLIYVKDFKQSKYPERYFKLKSFLTIQQQKYLLSINEYNLLLNCGNHLLIDNIVHKEFKRLVKEHHAIFSLYLPIFINSELTAFVMITYQQLPRYTKKTLTQARELADRFAVAIANAAKEDKLYHQANYDLLTDLPNRRLFYHRLHAAVTYAQYHEHAVALLYIDLNKFKSLNDAFGHGAGDQYLKTVANRIKTIISNNDTAARIGGDEFVIILSQLPQDSLINTVSIIANKIQLAIAAPCIIYNNNIVLNSSIGIALYPLDADNIDDLIKAADAALYYSKHNGSQNFHFYSQDINHDTKELLKLENNFNHALANNEFELYFQPRINVKTKTIVGAEALIRWQKNNRYISPDDFIPIAENNGLIQSLGEWTMQQACKVNKQLYDLGFNLNISINISATQLQNIAFFSRIENIIIQYALPPNTIELEITESFLLQKTTQTIELLQRLRNFGIQISLDDFGTGYSSLTYLQNYQVDILKIDQSFIKNIHNSQTNQAIVTAIIQLANNLDIKVVAEGIELTEEMEWLVEHQCDELQGYLFSKPLSFDDFAKYLHTQATSKTINTDSLVI